MTETTRRALIRAAGAIELAAMTSCSPQTPPAPEGTPDMTPSQRLSKKQKALLVYFSRAGENYWEGGRRKLKVGNTKRLAQLIAARIRCDVYEITEVNPYSEAYDPTVQRNVQEQDADARPAIAGQLPGLSGYDTVLLGSPVWNMRAPMVMSTFIDGVDLAGKTVLPFVTFAVSGIAGVDTAYRNALRASNVRQGPAVRGEDVDNPAAAADTEAWLRANALM